MSVSVGELEFGGPSKANEPISHAVGLDVHSGDGSLDRNEKDDEVIGEMLQRLADNKPSQAQQFLWKYIRRSEAFKSLTRGGIDFEQFALFLDVFDKFAELYPEKHDAILDEMRGVLFQGHHPPLIARRRYADPYDNTLNSLSRFAFVLFLSFSSLFFTPTISYSQSGPTWKPNTPNVARRISLPITDPSAVRTKSKECNTTTHDDPWTSYINGLTLPPPKLKGLRLKAVQDIYASAHAAGLGFPIADFVKDDDDPDVEFFRLFWKVGRHHLEIDIYESGYVNWFYMHMDTKDKVFGDEHEDIGVPQRLLEKIGSIT